MTEQQPAGPVGVPATGAGAIVDLISADPPVARQSSVADLLDQALAAPRDYRTRVERWVDEPNTFAGGHWVEVEG